MDIYTIHIHLYDVVFFGIIFTGLNFALLLGFVKSANRGANRFLAFALVTMVLWMIQLLALDIGLKIDLHINFLLALGPLLYFYVLKITHRQFRFRWRDGLHFIPLLLTPVLQLLSFTLSMVVFFSMIVYLYRSHRLIDDFYKGQHPILMDRPRLEFRWLHRLILTTAWLWLLWVICAGAGKPNDYAFYILFAVILIWTAVAAFLKPQAKPSLKSTVTTDLKQKANRLNKLMKEQAYYRDPELSLASLAEKLGLHTHELSRIINTGLKKSFYDFVNEFRVQAVSHKMQDPGNDHITLLGLAFESGFNSQASFSRIFKQMTGKTPAAFKNELKKERSGYKLRSEPPVTPLISDHQKSKQGFMFRNYVKIAWRNIIRNRAFSFINIFGLGLGLACALLIILWVQDELSIDTFHTNRADIYSVYERVLSEGKIEAGRATPALLAAQLKSTIPEIKYASGYWEDRDETLLTVGDKNFSNMGTYADSDFFKIFSYPLLQGTPADALSAPDDIAISRTMADNIFGSPQAAMGKTVKFNNFHLFKVNAVFEDLPANTSQHFDFVINWQYLIKAVNWLSDWGNRAPETFVQLQPGSNAAAVEAKIKNFVTSYLTANYRTGYRVELGLQPLKDFYLNSVFKDGKPNGGRIEYVRLFSVIAVFILIIACVNFMNLATARSVKRAKEVGIRKVVGAVRYRLIIQFIGEALLLTLLAAIIALILVLATLPYFSQLTGKHFALPIATPCFWLGILALILSTGFVAGSYPAFFLSSLNPVKVLKSRLKFSPNALLFRKGLVVFQFVLSIMLITGTLVISRQLNYVQTKNLGFDRQNLIYMHFPYPQGLAQGFKLFKQELSAMPGIKAVDYSMQPPSNLSAYTYNLNWQAKNPSTKAFAVRNWVGYDYFTLMGVRFLEGRAFSTDFFTDTTGVIINETALKMMNLQKPLGQLITVDNRPRTIIGVVKDFHFASLHDPIQPLVLTLNPDPTAGYVLVKTEAGKTRQGVASLAKVYTQMERKFPFRYSFADEEYQKLYNDEMTVGKLSDSFSILAIFISCLGLLGLTMFTAEQRKKEIGVRKVLGASEFDIVNMLSKDILKLVVLAALIAMPLAWVAMNNWLQNFAYRIALNAWLFFTAGLIAMLIALGTVSYQAIIAALTSPVKSLRSE